MIKAILLAAGQSKRFGGENKLIKNLKQILIFFDVDNLFPIEFTNHHYEIF